MLNIAKLAGGGLLAFTLAVACGGMSSQAGGSNTNWFATCTSTAECGSGLECWCGICTATCATECSAHASATCSDPPATCADPSKKTACAVQCTKDADCSSLGANASCVDTICRNPSHANEDGGTLSCDARSAAIEARLAPIQDGVDKACVTTADCVDFLGVSCEGGCGQAIASKKGVTAVASELATIENELCVPFRAAGCKTQIPRCPFAGSPTCVSGQCRRELPSQPLDSGTGSCDSIANDVVDRLLTATDAADTSCQKDADCTRSGPGATCLPECLYRPVSNAGAASIAAERAKVDRDLCTALDAQGCSPLIYTCVAIPPTAPVCLRGKCQDSPGDAGSTNSPPGDSGSTNSPPGDSGLSCADRTAQIRAELEGPANSADRKCALASDCTTVTLANQCYLNCTYVPASSAGAKTIQDALSSVDRTECPAFKDAACTVIALPCRAPPGETCQVGVCTLAP